MLLAWREGGLLARCSVRSGGSPQPSPQGQEGDPGRELSNSMKASQADGSREGSRGEGFGASVTPDHV